MSLNAKGKNFSITGVDELIKQLDTQFNERRSTRIQNQAINDATETFREGLEKAVSVYSDGSGTSTGATANETTRSRASKKANGTRTSRVGWNGPKQRYKLVHLNEFGYTRWGKTYSPRGSGVIRAYIDKSQNVYLKDIRDRFNGVNRKVGGMEEPKDMLEIIYEALLENEVIAEKVTAERISYYEYPEYKDDTKALVIIDPLHPPILDTGASDKVLTTMHTFQIDVQSPVREEPKQIQKEITKVMMENLGFVRLPEGLDEHLQDVNRFVDARRYRINTKLYDTNY